MVSKKNFLNFLLVLFFEGSLAFTPLAADAQYGIVVKSELDPHATLKRGVLAVDDLQRQLFASSKMTPTDYPPSSGNTSSYADRFVPRWVQVTWREGSFVQDFQTAGWRGGSVKGDYKIEVASRIPPAVYTYASQGKGRSIRLTFRIKDDGVLLAWSVEEKYAGGFFQSLWGGDFPCDPPTEYMLSQGISNRCISGNLTEQPWYRAEWHGQ